MEDKLKNTEAVKNPERKKSHKEENVLKVVEAGKQKGVLTYKEIADILDDVHLEPEQLERLYEALDNAGVDVLDDTAALNELAKAAETEDLEAGLDSVSIDELHAQPP